MSLGNCIPGMVERGEIDETRGRRMAELFDRLEAGFKESMGPEAAAAQASEETLRQMERMSALKKRQTLLQASVQKRAVADVVRYKGRDRYAAIRAMIDNDVRAPYENVIQRGEALEYRAQGEIADFIQHHRRDFLGKPRDASGLDDVIREMHGQATGNARAKTFSDALIATFERMRQRFNAAGGDIGKLKGWGFRHQHDALKVRKATYEQWRGDIRDGLDIAAMRDPDTGGPITASRLEQLLRGAYETIRSGGLIGEPLDSFIAQPKLANARKAPRTFIFKDGDAWLAYDAKYGSGNVFTSLMHHIHGMSEDIAAMERFGPNPDATVKFLLDSVDRGEAQSTKKMPGAVIGMSGGRDRTENLWKFVRGEFNAPVLAEGAVQKVSFYALRGLAGTREMLTAALLGSSPLSAIADVATQVMARKFNGMPQVSVLSGYLKQLNPASAADRKLAIRLGLGMRDASRSMLGLSRYVGETHGPSLTSIVADDVLRLSGINKFTEAGQRAFGLDLLGTLGDHRSAAFEALPPALRTGMERYGISASDWNAIRAAEPERVGSAEYVTARSVADRGAADRLMDMVFGETSAAVVENTASARALVLAGTRPGTIGGEGLRNSFQFKSFAVTLLMQQAQRVASLGPYRGAAYAAQFFVGCTLFGAASIQLREIAKGNDPRPTENPEFWFDAALQGGGAGIFGDLIGAFKSDRIDSLSSLALGPMFGLVKDVGFNEIPGAFSHKTKSGAVHQGTPGKSLVDFGRRYLPGSNLWYLRAAYQHEIMDRLSEEIDPNYATSRARTEQFARENGQGMWWRPGQHPDRAPDWSNAMTAGPAH